MSAEAAALPMGARLNGGLKPLLILVGIAAAVAAGVSVVLWTRDPTYSLLMAEVRNEEAAAVTQSLEGAGIPYRIDTVAGTISVPVERVNEARLKLAGEGLPASGGLASISKDSAFGVSQLMENARYQYAVETELAKTIASLQPVAGARVHLAIPEKSAFLRDRQTATASVFLQLKAGKRLESEQVTAIVNLVASSISGLDAGRVTVVDQQGRLLSAPQGDDEFSIRDKQYEFAHKLEEMYTRRIEQLLAPLAGAGSVRAQVVADVEMSTIEETREQYRPESQVVRSEQVAEERSAGGAGVQGVPGALTNQPPAGGTIAAAATTAPNAATTAANTAEPAAGNSSRQSTRNYEIDRTLAYTKQLPGRLKRLTVAVLVDNARTVDANGKATETPFTPEQLENMTRLVKDGVGYDEKRGDSVNVVNAAFRQTAAAEEGELQTTSLLERPIVWSIAKLLGGFVVLLVLIMLVLRPLVRGLITPPRMQSITAVPVGAGLGAQPVQSEAKPQIAYEQQIAQARTVVNQDPRRVAQVVKGWVGQDE